MSNPCAVQSPGQFLADQIPEFKTLDTLHPTLVALGRAMGMELLAELHALGTGPVQQVELVGHMLQAFFRHVNADPLLMALNDGKALHALLSREVCSAGKGPLAH